MILFVLVAMPYINWYMYYPSCRATKKKKRRRRKRRKEEEEKKKKEKKEEEERRRRKKKKKERRRRKTLLHVNEWRTYPYITPDKIYIVYIVWKIEQRILLHQTKGNHSLYLVNISSLSQYIYIFLLCCILFCLYYIVTTGWVRKRIG